MAGLTQCLPPERFIRSEITIDDHAPTSFAFGCIMLVTDEVLGGPGGAASPINATDRVRTYVTIDEVAADWDATSQAYAAALAVFSQSPRPTLVKVGFVSAYTQAEMDELNTADSECYGYVTTTLRDSAEVLDIAAWIEARTKVYATTTNDPLTEDAVNLTNIAEQLKQAGYDRTIVFYHDDAQYFPDAAFLSIALANDFDQANSAYTGKFASPAGIPAAVTQGPVAQIVTGYVPQVGLDANQGHFANTVVCLCDKTVFVEGNMASGRFFDTMHATDWISTRIEEALCALKTRQHVPYTQAGLQMHANAVEDVLRTAQLAGIVAENEIIDGEFLAGMEITVPRTVSASASQRANRVAPCIQYVARLTGAFHSACALGTATVFAS